VRGFQVVCRSHTPLVVHPPPVSHPTVYRFVRLGTHTHTFGRRRAAARAVRSRQHGSVEPVISSPQRDGKNAWLPRLQALSPITSLSGTVTRKAHDPVHASGLANAMSTSTEGAMRWLWVARSRISIWLSAAPRDSWQTQNRAQSGLLHCRTLRAPKAPTGDWQQEASLCNPTPTISHP